MSRPQPLQRSYLESEPLKLKQWTGSYDDKRKAAVEWAKLVAEQKIKKASVGDFLYGGDSSKKKQKADDFDESVEDFTNVPGLLGKVWNAAKGVYESASEAFAGPEDLTAQAKHKKKAASPGGIISNGVSEAAHDGIGDYHDPDQLEGDRHKPKSKPSLQQTV